MAERALEQPSISSRQQDTPNSTDISNENIFSDEFALEPSDNAPPSASSGDGALSTPSFNQPPYLSEVDQASAYNHDILLGDRNLLPIAEPLPRQRNSRSLNYNTRSIGSISDLSDVTSAPSRPISSIANYSIARTQSPYQGATGPSQPYGSYAQDTGLPRNPNASTNPTTRTPERWYAGTSGPSQPYGRYAQNTLTEDEISPAIDNIPSVTEFPNLRQNYPRRFGPDGEDAADLVGPDGYTEQLPPYTRFPNNIPPKSDPPRSANPPIDPPINPPLNPQAAREESLRPQTNGADGSGGPQVTWITSHTPTSSHSGDTIEMQTPGDATSVTQLNSPSGKESSKEGGHLKDKVKDKARRRCLGIPYWLGMVLLFLVAIVIGAVIGGVLGKLRSGTDEDTVRNPSEPTAYVVLQTELNIFTNVPRSHPVIIATSTVTTTTYFDAVPIPSATALPPLPAGSFNIQLFEPSFSSSDCLDGSFQQAWACTIKGDLELNISHDAEHLTTISIRSGFPLGYWRYGPQPPELQTTLAVLPMKDIEHTDKGPAYYFQQSFDKLVILKAGDSDDDLGKRSPMNKEGYVDLGRRGSTSSATIENGAHTWFCHWNGTLLEAFIFSQESAQQSIPTPNPTATPDPTKFLRGDPTPFPSITKTYPKTIKMEERRHHVNDVGPYCEPMIIQDRVRATRDPNRPTIQLNETEPLLDKRDMRRRDLLQGLMVEKRRVVHGCQCKWLSS